MGQNASSKKIKFQIEYTPTWQEELKTRLNEHGCFPDDADRRGVCVKSCHGFVLQQPFSSAHVGPEHFPLRVKIPAPKGATVHLKLEFFFRGLCRPEWRLGDRTPLGSSKLRPYVQVTYNGKKQTTRVKEVAKGSDVDFVRDAGVFFEIAEEDTNPRELRRSRSNSDLSSPASKDNVVQIVVYDKRRLQSVVRGDPQVGRTQLVLHPGCFGGLGSPGCRGSQNLSLAGQPQQETLTLRRKDGSQHGEVTVQYTVLSLQGARETMAHASQQSLLAVATALTQLLLGHSGIRMLLDAQPKGLHALTEQEVQQTLHDALALLPANPHGSPKSDDAAKADKAWFEKLSDFSRRLLELVAKCCSDNMDIIELTGQWISRFTEMACGAAVEEDRLKRFLAAAQVHMEDLVPIDEHGQVDPLWRKSAAAEREAGSWHRALDQVPFNSQLGAGSFGYVWRARDSLTGRIYAVKNVVVPRRGFAHAAQRESEVADRLCTLPHKCLVELFHFRHFPDLRLYCFVMEFCGSGDLKHMIWQVREQCDSEDQQYAVPLQAYHWIGQILLGTEYLHARMDMLLRDLKADNVVVNAQGHAKLTDFGLCRFGKEATGDWTFGVPPGSPGYIAPEIVKGQSYDQSADLYSFGVLMWIILTGGLKMKHDDEEGNVKTSEPMPPCAKRMHMFDYKSLSQNWTMLRSCIEHPEKNWAQAVPTQSDADLILALTQEEARARPSIEDLRQHELMQFLCLPSPEASPQEVDEWLALAPPLGAEVELTESALGSPTVSQQLGSTSFDDVSTQEAERDDKTLSDCQETVTSAMVSDCLDSNPVACQEDSSSCHPRLPGCANRTLDDQDTMDALSFPCEAGLHGTPIEISILPHAHMVDDAVTFSQPCYFSTASAEGSPKCVNSDTDIEFLNPPSALAVPLPFGGAVKLAEQASSPHLAEDQTHSG